MENQTFTEIDKTSTKYEQAMLSAFIQKNSKERFYQKALERMLVTGEPNLKWNWSWWGFIGGWLFLLYRKSYLAALVVFTASIFSATIPFGTLILMVITGGIAPYLIIKKYYRLKTEIESHHQDEQARIKAMQEVGGYHTWVIWLAVIFYSLLLIGAISLSSLALGF